MNKLPTLIPLSDALGYEVQGVDTSRPLAPRMQELLRGALATRGLLLFRDQNLTEDQQISFACVFGKISRQGPLQGISSDATYVSNVRKDGAFGDVELHFHSDQAYFEFPMKAIMLYGIEVPTAGGETLFSSAAAARAAMSPDMLQRIGNQRVQNRFDYGRIVLNDEHHNRLASHAEEFWHPVLAIHADSGLPIHMVNQDHSKRFDTSTAEESEQLIAAINDLMMRPEQGYRHRWSKGDLVIWDNTLLHHARTPFAASERRTLRRCAIGHENEVPYAAT